MSTTIVGDALGVRIHQSVSTFVASDHSRAAHETMLSGMDAAVRDFRAGLDASIADALAGAGISASSTGSARERSLGGSPVQVAVAPVPDSLAAPAESAAALAPARAPAPAPARVDEPAPVRVAEAPAPAPEAAAAAPSPAPAPADRVGAPPARGGRSLEWLQALGSSFGLENDPGDHQTTGGKHSETSLHYSARAVDYGTARNSDAQIRELAAYAKAHPEEFSEVFYNPLGWGIKDGKVIDGLAIAGHDDHVHIAR